MSIPAREFLVLTAKETPWRAWVEAAQPSCLVAGQLPATENCKVYLLSEAIKLVDIAKVE